MSKSIDAYLSSKYPEWAQRGAIYCEDKAAVENGLAKLGIASNTQLANFFTTYSAHLLGGRHYKELLDPASPPDEMIDQTKYVHENLDIPLDFVALTSHEGEGMLLYEKSSGAVFDIGYEDIDQLVSGALQAKWPSFDAFLQTYYSDAEE
jgi:hypothetical protein